MKIKNIIIRIMLLIFIFIINISLFSYAGIATYDDVIKIYDNTNANIKLTLKNRVNEMIKEHWVDHYESKYRVDVDILKNMDIYYVGDEYMNKNYKFEYKGVVDVSEVYMMTAIINYYILHETYNKYGFVADDGDYEEPTEEMQKHDLEMIKDLSDVEHIIDWLSSDIVRYINELKKHIVMKVTVDEESKTKHIYYDYEDMFVEKVKDDNNKYINYYEKVEKTIDKFPALKEDKSLLSGLRCLLFMNRYGGWGTKDENDILKLSEYILKEGFYK